MRFTSAATAPELAEKDKKPALKEDRPCSRCSHLCSAHAPPNYTRMYCDVAGCSCQSYFPAKSHETVVLENLELRKQLADLEAKIAQLNTRSESAKA